MIDLQSEEQENEEEEKTTIPVCQCCRFACLHAFIFCASWIWFAIGSLNGHFTLNPCFFALRIVLCCLMPVLSLSFPGCLNLDLNPWSLIASTRITSGRLKFQMIKSLLQNFIEGGSGRQRLFVDRSGHSCISGRVCLSSFALVYSVHEWWNDEPLHRLLLASVAARFPLFSNLWFSSRCPESRIASHTPSFGCFSFTLFIASDRSEFVFHCPCFCAFFTICSPIAFFFLLLLFISTFQLPFSDDGFIISFFSILFIIFLLLFLNLPHIQQHYNERIDIA